MRPYYLLLSLLVLSVVSVAQTNENRYVQELETERGMFAKTYLKQNGNKEVILAGQPIHYKDNESWKDINTSLSYSSPNDAFVNESNVIKSLFPATISTNDQIQYEFGGKTINVSARKELITYDLVSGYATLGLNSTNTSGAINQNRMLYPSIYPGVSDEYTVENAKIKNNLVLHQPLQALVNSSADYFGFEETLTLPSNWLIEPQVAPVDGFIYSALNILNEHGHHVLTIPAPYANESNQASSDGSSGFAGMYRLSQSGQQYRIATLIEVEWLNDNNRLYPVKIDPTVVLAGADGGWQSQNNFVNNPGFVFIGVCCGNLEHRAWVKFNTTSIPDNSCVTNVEFEAYVNGVGGAAAELVHAFDITGAFGPYPGIMPAVYADMGNGYYTSFTMTGTGTYGYYDLGPTADALLQSQLPGNWFQVSLIFDNEPSTNWKRLTAGLCNLRVEYTAPPCVLPVELVSFDATCLNGKAVIEWETVTEVNNDRFEVERSLDGVNFELIGVVKGNGSTEVVHAYQFIDETYPQDAIYRLKQVDFNGSFEYSDMISTSCQGKNELLIYPNPVGETLNLEYDFPLEEVIVFNVVGEKMSVSLSKTKTIDVSHLSSGVYTLHYLVNNKSVVKKFFKQ